MGRISDHVLYVAKDRDTPITNLQLQKITYFVMGYIVKNNLNEEIVKKDLSNSKLEAWLYGPVFPEIYNEFKNHGSFPIDSAGKKDIELDELNNVNEIVGNLIDKPPFELVENSHKRKFWKENKEEIESGFTNPEYSFNDLYRDFAQ